MRAGGIIGIDVAKQVHYILYFKRYFYIPGFISATWLYISEKLRKRVNGSRFGEVGSSFFAPVM
jgi:hypothetical protein